MLQRFAPGAAQRTSVPGAAETVAPCPCAAKAWGGIEKTSATAPSRRQRRRMTILNSFCKRVRIKQNEIGSRKQQILRRTGCEGCWVFTNAYRRPTRNQAALRAGTMVAASAAHPLWGLDASLFICDQSYGSPQSRQTT